MKLFGILPVAFALLAQSALSQAEWVKQFGTGGDDYAKAIAADSAGIYVGGYTTGAFPGANVAAGGYDAFLARFDRTGSMQWVIQSGDVTDDRVSAVIADATGVYVTGLGGPTLRKYNADGTLVWSSGLIPGGTACHLALDGSTIYLSGYTTGTLSGQSSAGGFDLFLQKFDAGGNLQWTRQFGTAGNDFCAKGSGLAAKDGSVYLAGSSSDAFDGFTNAGNEDVFLRKYDAAGNALWTRQFGTPQYDSPGSIVVDSTGVYMSGSSGFVDYDAFARKYDANGALVWSKPFGTGSAFSYGAALDNTGFYVLLAVNGSLPGLTGSGNVDIGVRKFDRNGNILWTRQIGSAGIDTPTALVADGSSLYIVGLEYQQFVGQISAGGLDGFLMRLNPSGSQLVPGLRFIPTAPCRVIDTRPSEGLSGQFGPPALSIGARTFALPQGRCGIPLEAQAYALNMTVVPLEPLAYLTVWPAGTVPPVASTLNSFDGAVTANAALVRAGDGGSISVYATGGTELIVDVNGYFVPDTTPGSLSFYALDPCRSVDTRLQPPALAAGGVRSFTLPGSACGIPGWAAAYSLNATVVPSTALSYLTLWPSGQGRPLSSTLNSFDGSIRANAAVIPGGSSGQVSAYATDPTHLILDVNGFFGPPGNAGELRFYPVVPCRIADTRLTNLGAPMRAGETRDIAAGGTCEVPADAKAYALNVTVVPSGPLSFLTLWPTGAARPFVSTINSSRGRVMANAAIVPAGAGNSFSVFATDPTHVIVDINGYFQ